MEPTAPEAPCSFEVSYYASSLGVCEQTAEEIGTILRDHWSAIENGTHYRRDVTKTDSLRSWCQQQTFSTAWRLLKP